MQLPAGAGPKHWPSFGRWLIGTRPPPSAPLDDPSLEVDVVAPSIPPPPSAPLDDPSLEVDVVAP
jgi:hypothetical protein